MFNELNMQKNNNIKRITNTRKIKKQPVQHSYYFHSLINVQLNNVLET